MGTKKPPGYPRGARLAVERGKHPYSTGLRAEFAFRQARIASKINGPPPGGGDVET